MSSGVLSAERAAAAGRGGRLEYSTIAWNRLEEVVSALAGQGLAALHSLLSEPRCSRNQPLHHHRGCECTTASPAETAARGLLGKSVSLTLGYPEALDATWPAFGDI